MSEAALYREFVLRSSSVWAVLAAFVKAHAAAGLERGRPLLVIVTTWESIRTKAQNARLWSYLYRNIAEQAWLLGRQYEDKSWHELLGDMFLPKIEIVLPGGAIKSRRMSTTELSVGQFSEYMQRVEVYAASELGVRFP